MAGQRLGLVTVVVPDYDAGIAYFTRTLGFELLEDSRVSPTKRWVVVAPRGGGAGLLLALAATPAQADRVGTQTGGRVAFFLETDDFEADHALYQSRGVEFIEQPRTESYGTVVKFRDAFGNLWDLLERRTTG